MTDSPKVCRIWWNADTQMWWGFACAGMFQASATTVAHVYDQLAMQHRLWIEHHQVQR